MVADSERRVVKAELAGADALAHSRKRRRREKTTEVAKDQVSETGAADGLARGKKKCNQKVADPAAKAAVGALAPATEAAKCSDLASSSRADAPDNASPPDQVLA